MDKHSSQLLIKNAEIYLENEVLTNGFLLVHEEKIIEIGKMEDLKNCIFNNIDTINLKDGEKVIPGFVDVHIHGAGGADTMDGTTKALHTMAVHLPREGTTSFLATTITQSEEKILNALQNAAAYQKNNNKIGKAEVIGIHLEGPFINPEKKGAQPEEFIIEPNIEVFQEWQKVANGTIKIVTVAPEMPNGLAFIKYLADQGITASIGHSNSTYALVKEAAAAGATQVTHLFNGMRGLHHREPGTAGAALLIDELKVELIADGIHICPEMLQFILKTKGSHGALLITDAMRAKCLKSGHYELGGQPVIVADGKVTLEDGTLAGSILKMIDSVKNIKTFTNLTLHEIVKMASSTPAKQIHIFNRKGSIAVGKDADLIILNKDIEIEKTFCRGKLAYSKTEAR